MWRYFQISDHLYYMFTAGGAPGEVHSYFSPFGTPIDAYVNGQAAIFDFENRVRLEAIAADEPFLFYTGEEEKHFTGLTCWTMKGMTKALQKASPKSLEFHNSRGDFEKWAEKSLKDKTLAGQLKKLRLSKLKGEPLAKALAGAVRERFEELNAQIETSTRYF